MQIPDHLLYPFTDFAHDCKRLHDIGVSTWRDADVAIVGLARNCDRWLEANLARLVELCDGVGGWKLHIETNDNTDNTDQVLLDFCRQYRQATFTSQRLDRQHFTTEFAGPRTVALAEYRTNCQRWVKENARDADFVVVIDFDMWGGWSHAGFMHGVGALATSTTAFGMTSVSLLEQEHRIMDQSGEIQSHRVWVHYDAWALRLNSTYDDYTTGIGGWKHQWLPPVGSPTVPVCSAFGAMAIYDTFAFLAGTYDGSDCEHVPFHASIAKRTGQSLHLDPAMRTVMRWLA